MGGLFILFKPLFFNINIYVYKGVKYAENILTFYNDVIQL